MSKKDVAETKDLAVRPAAGLPVDTAMFDDNDGSDFEGAGQESYAIPFLKILQSLSPQCKKSEPEYIKGAEEGDFFNTVTEEVFSNEQGGVMFIPCYFKRVFNLWLPKAEGGGFRGSISSAEGEVLLRQCTRNDKNEDITPDGLVLVDTREHYGLVVDADNNSTPVLLALSSTQIKESKKWMTLMQGLRLPNGKEAPMASHIYQLTTIGRSNDQGSWAVLKVTKVGYVPTHELYEKAVEFREMIRSGAAKAAQENAADEDLPY